MRFHNKPYSRFIFLFILWLLNSTCSPLDQTFIEEQNGEWIENLIANNKLEVQKICKTGEGIENICQGYSAQGVMVKDRVMFRLYDSGLCQTFDLSDITCPQKIASFELGSHIFSNHANCAQGYMDENGEFLMYVSGLHHGKTYVERISTTGSTLVQTITLSKTELFDNYISLNSVCSDNGELWFFGSGGNKLFFAKARRPLLAEGDVTLGDDDFIDSWFEEGYNYDEDVWQGGKVYNGFLFMLFGTRNSKRHLAIYNTRIHERIVDIDFTNIIREETEDCEILPEGILIVTNGGNHYYLIRF